MQALSAQALEAVFDQDHWPRHQAAY
ncbi:MAG: hypothetical protein KBF40_13185 [Giesbergeria sp.]|nr:hypothetical protein [Giesbergeria sp.]